ncbi:hypothetical protein F4V57_03815 [Acinetobacter qingfengensis]|uniref:Uncharacterized protein n=1 Tax=Acinetobacter qingfengensis TaxID=1262585 RepID=A0A1E7RCC7_9GAMM|nr:hypothetical protein [Acinetobacter qingfengensis]KAA8734895.1 hypothetical protein F4V57_03815 [Acinetobacter qingfengensis]OEY96936.1 hypothetical protein BJI46_11680 [Acinetobacter qingfengensis]
MENTSHAQPSSFQANFSLKIVCMEQDFLKYEVRYHCEIYNHQGKRVQTLFPAIFLESDFQTARQFRIRFLCLIPEAFPKIILSNNEFLDLRHYWFNQIQDIVLIQDAKFAFQQTNMYIAKLTKEEYTQYRKFG